MEELVPTAFELAQNYPNPFGRKTIIKYCIPDKMKIRLEVFDHKGNKVSTLVDEIKEAGTFREVFNSDGLEDGEYLCKLESDYYFETKKMVLMK